MTSNSDEIVSMNYSFTSQENGKKGEEKSKKSNKNKKNVPQGKSQNSFKSPNLSGMKEKKAKSRISLPELDNNNSKMFKQKLHLTSKSFNKKNFNTPKKSNRTFNISSSITNNNICLYNYFNNDNKIKKELKKDESPIKTIDFLKKEIQNKNKIIESLISSNNNINNNIPYIHDKNNLVNILSTKQKNNKNAQQGRDEKSPSESKNIEKKYNNIKDEFEKQRKELNTLRKNEKITKNKEIEMENRILLEQCNKLNYLYFDVLKKLIEYED